MENKHQVITERQGNRFFILETFSASALFLPQVVLGKNAESGILSVAGACFLAGIYFLITEKMTRGISMEQMLKGHPLAAVFYYMHFWINGVFFYIYILFMVSRYLLPGRKPWFAGVPLMILAWMINRSGLRGRGRVMEGIFWFVLLPVIFVLLLSLTDLSLGELSVTTFSWNHFVNGMIGAVALLHPMELAWFYRGNINQGNMRVSSFLGLGILLMGIFCAVTGSLGRKMILYDENPVMSMAQGAAMPGGLMARLDIFLIAFWIVGVFCVFSGYLFYGNESIRNTFQNGGKIAAWLSYGGILFMTDFLFDLYPLFQKYFLWFIYGNLIIGMIFPLVLFLSRRRRKKNEIYS